MKLSKEVQKAEFSRRRNFLVPALQGLGFDIPLMPAGAFYVYAGLPENIEDAESFCKKLLELPSDRVLVSCCELIIT